jgi:hypothetical protein
MDSILKERLVDREQKFINDVRRFITVLLTITVGSTAAVRESTHAVALTIILAVASAIVIIWYVVREHTRTPVSLLPAAVAGEAIMALYGTNAIVVQILYTAVVGIMLFVASKAPFASAVYLSKEDDGPEASQWLNTALLQKKFSVPRFINGFRELSNSILYMKNPNYKYLWAVARIVLLTVSYADGTTELWFVAQLILAVCVMLLGTDDAAFDPENGKRGSMTRTYLCATAVFVVTFLYAYEHIIPARASLIVIALPMLYIINQSIPSATEKTQENSNALISTVMFATVVALLLGSLAYSDNAYNGTPVGDERCSSLLNLVECNEGETNTIGNCCCKRNHAPFKLLYGTKRYGCIPLACQSKIIKMNPATPTDCCKQLLTEGSIGLLAGSHLCACNNHPVSGNTNTVTKEGTCNCAAGATGKYCELVLHKS